MKLLFINILNAKIMARIAFLGYHLGPIVRRESIEDLLFRNIVIYFLRQNKKRFAIAFDA